MQKALAPCTRLIAFACPSLDATTAGLPTRIVGRKQNPVKPTWQRLGLLRCALTIAVRALGERHALSGCHSRPGCCVIRRIGRTHRWHMELLRACKQQR